MLEKEGKHGVGIYNRHTLIKTRRGRMFQGPRKRLQRDHADSHQKKQVVSGWWEESRKKAEMKWNERKAKAYTVK